MVMYLDYRLVPPGSNQDVDAIYNRVEHCIAHLRCESKSCLRNSLTQVRTTRNRDRCSNGFSAT
jgi:hypothetical protein